MRDRRKEERGCCGRRGRRSFSAREREEDRAAGLEEKEIAASRVSPASLTVVW